MTQQHKSEENLSEPLRKEIFLALVEAQDHHPDLSVKDSWKMITDKFGITVNQLRTIERDRLVEQPDRARIGDDGGDVVDVIAVMIGQQLLLVLVEVDLRLLGRRDPRFVRRRALGGPDRRRSREQQRGYSCGGGDRLQVRKHPSGAAAPIWPLRNHLKPSLRM